MYRGNSQSIRYIHYVTDGSGKCISLIKYTGWPVFDLTVWNVKYLKNLWRNIEFLLHKSLHIQKGLEKQKGFTHFLQVCLWQSFLFTNSNTWIYGTFYFLKCLWNPYPSRFFDSLNCHLKPDYPAFRCTKKFCSSSYSFGIASN